MKLKKYHFDLNKSFAIILDEDFNSLVYARLFFTIFIQLFPQTTVYVFCDKKAQFLFDSLPEQFSFVSHLDELIDMNTNLVVSFSKNEEQILYCKRVFKNTFISFSDSSMSLKNFGHVVYDTYYHPVKGYFKFFDFLGVAVSDLLVFISKNNVKKTSGKILVNGSVFNQTIFKDMTQEFKMDGFELVYSDTNTYKQIWHSLDGVDCVLTNNVTVAHMAAVRGLFVLSVGLEQNTFPWGGSFINCNSFELKDIKQHLDKLIHEEYDQPLEVPVLREDNHFYSYSTLFFGQATSDFVSYLEQEKISFCRHYGLTEYINIISQLFSSKFKLVIVGQVSGDVLSFIVYQFLVLFLRLICLLKKIKVVNVRSEFELKYKLSL
ncbi:MAG: hypothetical protein CMP39_05075 [Rickettsiales bacterium]|nr:hypothetical protein [Rickettsiales bacterium]